MPDLANTNLGCPVKCEFQIDNKYIFFGLCPKYHTLKKKVCDLSEIQIYLGIPHFIWQSSVKRQAKDPALDLTSLKILKREVNGYIKHFNRDKADKMPEWLGERGRKIEPCVFCPTLNPCFRVHTFSSLNILTVKGVFGFFPEI